MSEPTDSTWDLVAEQPDPFEPLANIDRRVYCMSWRTAVRLFDDAVVNPALWSPDALREIVRRVEDQYRVSWARREAIWENILPVQDGDELWDGFTDELKRALQERAEYRDGLGSLHKYLRARIQAVEAQQMPAVPTAPIAPQLAGSASTVIPIDREALYQSAAANHPEWHQGKFAAWCRAHGFTSREFRQWRKNLQRSDKPGALKYPDTSPKAQQIMTALRERRIPGP